MTCGVGDPSPRASSLQVYFHFNKASRPWCPTSRALGILKIHAPYLEEFFLLVPISFTVVVALIFCCS
jgi:hypothetical protein